MTHRDLRASHLILVLLCVVVWLWNWTSGVMG